MITEKFDGDITLESEVGVGSSFTFKFKLEVEDQAGEQIEQQNTGRVVNKLNSETIVFTWKPLNPTYSVRYHAYDDNDEAIFEVESSEDVDISEMKVEEDEEALPNID